MDDDMDMCEYMWSNEMAMRRLLNMVSRFFIFSPKIFSHNYVIVTQLRHGQSYCTDTECIDRKFEKIKFTFINFLQKTIFFPRAVPPTHPGDVVSDGGNNFLMMTVLLAVAVMLYVMRPNTIRGNGRNQMNGNGKPARPNDDVSSRVHDFYKNSFVHFLP